MLSYIVLAMLSIFIGMAIRAICNAHEMTFQRAEGYKDGQRDYKKSLTNSLGSMILIVENEKCIDERERWFILREIEPPKELK